MRNDRMFQTSDDVTLFTKAVIEKIAENGHAQIKCRNGRVFDNVLYDKDNSAFYTDGFYWDNDGSSVKHDNFDIIELIE